MKLKVCFWLKQKRKALWSWAFVPNRIDQFERTILMKINELIEAYRAFNEQVQASTTKLLGSVEGLSGDVKSLADKITALQSGDLNPEQQAQVEAILAQSGTLASNLAGVATALEALDGLTPPTPTPEPPPQDPAQPV